MHFLLFECRFSIARFSYINAVILCVTVAAPKLGTETFKAIKPGLSAYADDPEKVRSVYYFSLNSLYIWNKCGVGRE